MFIDELKERIEKLSMDDMLELRQWICALIDRIVEEQVIEWRNRYPC